ncbi:hypothetical protein HHI36_003759 [Cryptolaemus montrouzieri]|uniref:Uncharacterized protein n=1 Tax=Cryptolaemus montrouzieri TaxID=559131 RepID=A0ABD2PEY0_9CUCU
MKITFDLMKAPSQEKIPKTYDFNRCNMKEVNKILFEFTRNIQDIDENMITSFPQLFSEAVISKSTIICTDFFTQNLLPFIIAQIKRKRKKYREYKTHQDPGMRRSINESNKNIQNKIQERTKRKKTTGGKSQNLADIRTPTTTYCLYLRMAKLMTQSKKN